MKTTEFQLTKELTEQMCEKIRTKDEKASVFILSEDCKAIKNCLKSRFFSIDCSEAIPKKKYDLIVANPPLYEESYRGFISELFKNLNDNGQLITFCLDSWLEKYNEEEDMLRKLIETSGHYEDVKDNLHTILLTLYK